MTYKITEFDALTGETIDRKATTAEIADFKAREAKLVAIEKAEADRAKAKTALLEKLGITEDEAKLLLS